MPLPFQNITQIPVSPKPAAIPSLWNIRYDQIDANFAYLLGLLNGFGTASGMLADTDITLAANSDSRLATQKAIKAYIGSVMAANDAMVFKNAINCSTNPNYPAADSGHTYRVSAAGKIGGASGVNVELGDILTCIVDGTVAGTQLSVGANWVIIQANLDGAALLTVAQTWGKAQRGAPLPIAYSANISIDFSTSNNFALTLTGNATLSNPTNIAAGQGGVITIKQDATGGRTLAFGSAWRFTKNSIPSLTTTPGATDEIGYYVNPDLVIKATINNY